MEAVQLIFCACSLSKTIGAIIIKGMGGLTVTWSGAITPPSPQHQTTYNFMKDRRVTPKSHFHYWSENWEAPASLTKLCCRSSPTAGAVWLRWHCHHKSDHHALTFPPFSASSETELLGVQHVVEPSTGILIAKCPPQLLHFPPRDTFRDLPRFLRNVCTNLCVNPSCSCHDASLWTAHVNHVIRVESPRQIVKVRRISLLRGHA